MKMFTPYNQIRLIMSECRGQAFTAVAFVLCMVILSHNSTDLVIIVFKAFCILDNVPCPVATTNTSSA